MTAIIAPPNTWDSMAYHMARVPHWIQNGTLDFYPTSIDRQLWAGPFAEYCIMLLQLLSGSDRWANMVQFVSMLSCLIGVFLITKRLGGNSLAQVFAIFLTVTIPVGILQASSTKNDYVAAMWMGWFVFLLLELKSKWCWKKVFGAGICLALGILTKGTVYLYGFAFLSSWIVYSWKAVSVYRIIKTLTIFILCVLVFNGHHYFRNYQLSGNFIQPSDGAKSLENDVKSPAGLLSSLLLNASLHLAGPIEPLNKFIEKGLINLHAFLGLDINDPRITATDFRIAQHMTEDETGNLRHFLLFIFALIVFLNIKELRANNALGMIACGVLLSFVVFAWFLKWQSSGTRLQLAIFVLSAPFMAVVMTRVCPPRIIVGLCVVFMLCSYPWLFKNQPRRLLSTNKSTIFNTRREELYFAHRVHLYNPYKKATDILAKGNCRNIGLLLGRDSWEYPLWALLPEYGRKYRIEHILVKDWPDVVYPLGEFKPCAIFSDQLDSEEIINYEEEEFGRVLLENGISLYIK